MGIINVIYEGVFFSVRPVGGRREEAVQREGVMGRGRN